MAPLISELKSTLAFEESSIAPSEGSPRQITASSVTQTTIVSADLSSAAPEDYVGKIFESLDGDTKGQMVLCTAFNPATDTATVTSFFAASPTGTEFKMWQFNGRWAVSTSAGSNTTTVSTNRTEADDYWNDFYMMSVTQGELRDISDFVASTDTFTHGAFTAATVDGELLIPCVPIQPEAVELKLGGGDALERTIVTDTLAQEGVIRGAMSDSTISIQPEIRGLASAAGNGTAATRPLESHVLLDAVFSETLDTGDDVVSSANSQYIVATETSATFSQYDLMLVNGEVAAISTATDDISGAQYVLPSGHLSAAATAGDILYAGCNYKPIDTGHESVGFMAYHGDSEFVLMTGCMPAVGVEIEPNGIAKYKFDYNSVGGFWSSTAKTHNDIYDTTAPLVGKSNVSRVVLGGTELLADVLSLSAELLPAPAKRGAAFGAFENNGGFFYTTRQPQVSMQIYFQDSDLLHKYRAQTEFDLLIQVGSTAGACWALWVPRAQIVANPEVGEAESLMTYNLVFRALRPSTAAQPDFVMAHF